MRDDTTSLTAERSTYFAAPKGVPISRKTRDIARERLAAVSLALGDETYFAQLYRNFTLKFRAFLRTTLRHADGVDDIIPETWLHVLKHRTTFKNQGPLGGWLWTICRNSCANWLRSQRRLSALQEQGVPLASEYLLSYGSQEHAGAPEELVCRIHQAIIALPDRQ